MNEQNSIPVTKVERSAKFVKTGFQIGGNYIKHYSKKLFNPDLGRDELNEDNATDIYKSLSELKGCLVWTKTFFLNLMSTNSHNRNIMPRHFQAR
jgi:hypothetical protein